LSMVGRSSILPISQRITILGRPGDIPSMGEGAH
jgi:hypothetical protein